MPVRRPPAGQQPAPRRARKPPRRQAPHSARPRRRLPGALLFLFGLLIGAGVFYLGCGTRPRGGEEPRAAAAESLAPSPSASEHAGETPDPTDAAPESTPAPSTPSDNATEPAASAGSPAPSPAPDGARLAIVIDDLGGDMADLAVLGRLGVPITYAVLPFEEHTTEVVAELRRQGVEILLHLPMEAQGGNDPGPGALLYGMPADELERRTAAALAAVPGASGVNNHMGSRLS
ncbi:MAG TPA: divergent polysaccharide deacetylase family protein, partial [Thermoanaerobaculia bacterium]|nr:divergent polysaccharide deacetylase family protein [Thermoanaerobaculia bacterium]